MSEERLQRILARAGLASRRAAEELVRAGRVTVNGRVAGIGDKADPESDAIKLDGRRVEPRRPHVYLLLNKPDGVMTTRSDPQGRPTVFDLVPARLRKGLIAVGRLDFHSEGLLLLTDDGDLAQRVTHPRFGCRKTYAAKVKGVPDRAAVARLRTGVVIDGRKTAPARVRLLKPPRREESNSWWEIEIGEGRTRQIREMFRRVGHPVQKLRRVAIGPVSDRQLPRGAYRELATAEIADLRRGGGRRKPERRRARRSRPAAEPEA